MDDQRKAIKLSEAEKQGIRESSDAMNRWLEGFFTRNPHLSFLVEPRERLALGPAGTTIRFPARGRARHCWHYYRASDGWMFAYTSLKDENGKYWSWAYRPEGKGARGGKAKEWAIAKSPKPVAHSKRSAAIRRANRLLHKHMARKD
jgi:hypothetical protein